MKRPLQSLGDRIDPQDRTFEARVKLRNTEHRAIKPNMSAELRFTDFRTDSAMVVPSGIVGSDPEGDHVYVVASDTAQKRYIQLGPSQGGRSLVAKGLDFGERVVVAGQSELSDGMSVRQEGKKVASEPEKKREP
jgi:multidrug efflux pump subunit AcrA (membrane-fusion protein)